MTNQLINKYIWLIDTIRRRGRITRRELDERWMRSAVGDGKPIPRRTFYNYRQAIAETFGITLEYDPVTFEYYIGEEDPHDRSVTDWLLDNNSMNYALTGARDISGKIFLENVPSARDWLNPVIEALRANMRLNFDYHPYTRTSTTCGIVLEPYLLKIFRQRWYVAGRNVAENRFKTYALDRMTRCVVTDEGFEPDEDFDAETYFKDAFGIVVDQGPVRQITLRTDPRQAKYFRALPLHPSQSEQVCDGYSDFSYRMRVTDDLVTELLSYGSRIQVVEPRELQTRIRAELKLALDLYQ